MVIYLHLLKYVSQSKLMTLSLLTAFWFLQLKQLKSDNESVTSMTLCQCLQYFWETTSPADDSLQKLKSIEGYLFPNKKTL